MPSKTQKFKENELLPNLWQCTVKNEIKQGLDNILKQNKPIILELGCGGGDYTLALAKHYPDWYIIGLDIQGERLWHGATQALSQSLNNALFIRMYADHLLDYFPTKSVAEIWITFPDPYPKTKQIKKRLTSPKFLNIYSHVLKPKGYLHLKTDNLDLFDYSTNQLEQSFWITNYVENVYASDSNDPLLYVPTYYEKKYLKQGRNIYYLKAQYHY